MTTMNDMILKLPRKIFNVHFQYFALFILTSIIVSFAFQSSLLAHDSNHATLSSPQKTGVEDDGIYYYEQFRWPEEEFYYSVRFNGIEAMRAGVRVGDVRQANNRAYVPISGTVQSVGMFNSVYPIDDTANTFFDPLSLYPLRSEKHFDEKNQSRSFHVNYRHRRNQAKVKRTQPNSIREFTATMPSNTHDMLTWMYELRAQHSIYIGKTMTFYIYDGWLLSRLDLTVVARDDIHTPMGWFKAWKIDFSRSIMNVDSDRARRNNSQSTEPVVSVKEPGRHTGSLWVSRDENLLPIRVSINTPLGIGDAVLIRYKPATKPPLPPKPTRSMIVNAPKKNVRFKKQTNLARLEGKFRSSKSTLIDKCKSHETSN